MEFAQKLSHYIDYFHKKLCDLVSLFTLMMTALMFTIVVLRYGFDLGWVAMQESAMYLHSAIFLMGAAHTLKLDEHVRVDVFYRNFDERKKAKVDLFGGVMFLLPLMTFILVMSWDYVAKSWSLMEASQAAGGLPILFVLKTFILIFAGTLFLQGISEILKNIMVLNKDSRTNSEQVY